LQVDNASKKINLGCGYRKMPGYINIDNRPETNPDLCCDILDGLPFEDESVDEVRAHDILEHIPIGKTVGVIEDIYRVLKKGGKFESFTPSTDGRGAFQDPTHVSFWNRNTWMYYMFDHARELYGIRAKFAGSVQDIYTDEANQVIHTFANLTKV
jgi:predicted SAM-dependent methyltransferase